jgi:hypothetical protein
MSPIVASSRWLRDLTVAALALLVLCTAAWADPPGRVGRLAELNGTVWIYDGEQGEWVLAQRNRPVTTGDRLATDTDARAEMQVGSTTMRVDGATELEVVRLDDQNVRIHVAAGSLAVKVRARDVAREIEVITAEGSFVPSRAGHYRVDRRDDATHATVWAGDLQFESRDSALSVTAGQQAQFWSESGVTHYTWSGVEHDNFSQWAQAEDRRADANANPYVSPEMTGAEDLDRYGTWETTTDYGTLWYPHRVASGWAPYRMGHWTWVSPWGWTWVDDAPWGFAPFHYGRWVMWRGHWAWAPGRYVARPVYAPALVAWIGGGNASVGISIGSSRPPLVGWVPLAPHERWVPYYPASTVYVRNVNVTHVHVNPGQPKRAREPIMYTNRGVPGGVTMVSSDVLRQRRPVMTAAINANDPDIARRVATERVATDVAPARPERRAVANAPVPPAPGRVVDLRSRYPQLQEHMRRPNGFPEAITRPPAVARPSAPVGRDTPMPRYAPRGGESQANESAARRPAENAIVRPVEPTVRQAPPREMRAPQRPEMREPMQDSRPRPAPSARGPSPQAAQAENARPMPAAPAQRAALPVAPVAPPAVTRPVAPPPEAVQSTRPGSRPETSDDPRGSRQMQGNGNGNWGRGPRQQER